MLHQSESKISNRQHWIFPMILSTSFPALTLVVLCVCSNFTKAEFVIYDGSTFDDNLGSRCVEALATSIDCDPYVQTFSEPRYHGELDLKQTDSICSSICGSSLKTWFDTVDTQCAGKTVYGAIPVKLGGYMWAGYNETCLRDPRPPRAYCNGTLYTRAIKLLKRLTAVVIRCHRKFHSRARYTVNASERAMPYVS
jgi:hypothetical protein